MSKVAVGIDLGTTYSCIAAFTNMKVEVLTDSDGNRTMPSVVAFIEDGNGNSAPEVGETARKNVDVDIGNRVYGKSCAIYKQ
jgi:heat shock protein 1/8